MTCRGKNNRKVSFKNRYSAVSTQQTNDALNKKKKFYLKRFFENFQYLPKCNDYKNFVRRKYRHTTVRLNRCDPFRPMHIFLFKACIKVHGKHVVV